MTLDTDFHSHVSYTSAHEMAQSACEKGLRILGLSEHVFQMREARPSLLQHPASGSKQEDLNASLQHARQQEAVYQQKPPMSSDFPLWQEGPLLTFAEYIEAARTADQSLPIDVRLGLEVDFIPERNESIQAAIQPYDWDFLIGSVHEVDGYAFERPHHLAREEGEHYWLRYFQLLRDAVCSGYFSMVSHPVRMRVFNPHLPPTLDEELERLAAEATRCNVAMEINGSDMLAYPGLVRRLALACASQRTPISVGSDAHEPSEVAQAHRQSAELLREVGISTVRVWKQRVAEEYAIA